MTFLGSLESPAKKDCTQLQVEFSKIVTKMSLQSRHRPGTMHLVEFVAKPEALTMLEENWDLLAPHFLDYNYTLPKEKHVEVARLIKTHYFGSAKIDSTTKNSLIQMAGDRFFVVDSEKAARMQAEVNQLPVWYYYYSYRGSDSLSRAMSGTDTNYGMLFRGG